MRLKMWGKLIHLIGQDICIISGYWYTQGIFSSEHIKPFFYLLFFVIIIIIILSLYSWLVWIPVWLYCVHLFTQKL